MLRRFIAVHRVGSRAIGGKSTSTERVFQTTAWQLFIDNSKRWIESHVKDAFSSFKVWLIGGTAAIVYTILQGNSTIMELLTKVEMKLDGEGHSQTISKERLEEVAAMISRMCVDPETKRPYPASEIQRALLDNPGFNFKSDRSSKQIALEAIPLLRGTMKIERAKMRVRVSIPAKNAAAAHGKLKAQFDAVEEENWDKGDLMMVGYIPPNKYEAVLEIVQSGGKKSYVELAYAD